MATIEERFQAAVNVIKGLPKNGPYQPSTAMMLKFYGYYKQATEGPCLSRKPAFWDVIGRAKWDAWKCNQHLTKRQAMQKYVDDLREIIETMSFTDNVQNFVGSINETRLDNINLDELEMVAPGMRQIAQSHPNSPFNSRTNSPQRDTNAINDESTQPAVTINGHGHYRKKDNGTGENDGDNKNILPISIQSDAEIPDEPQQQLQQRANAEHFYIAPTSITSNIEHSDEEYGDPVDLQHDFTDMLLQNSELLKKIQATVARMNGDVVNVTQRMSTLEKVVLDMRCIMRKARLGEIVEISRTKSQPVWWPFEDITPAWFVILVLWPFIITYLPRMLRVSHRK